MMINKIVKGIELLKAKKQKVAFVEGASNGSISEAFLSYASAEGVVLGNMVALKDHMKGYFFQIDTETLQRYGSESAEVAKRMAKGLSEYFDADIYVSITGNPTDNADKETPATYIHIVFPDDQIAEKVAFTCAETSEIDQTLARVCQHIKNKLIPQNECEFEIA